MPSPTPSDDGPPTTEPAPRVIRPPRSLPSSRAAVGGLLVAAAALGTWAAAGGGSDPAPHRYVTARRPVAPGVALTDDDLALVAVDLPAALRAHAYDDPPTSSGP